MNVQQLAQAVEGLKARDALPCQLGAEEWMALVPYLTPRMLRTGEVLMKEGDAHRELFILGEGELEVRAHGHTLAALKPGSIAGEGTFFSGEPRSATVLVARPGIAFGLQWERFDELSRKHPRLAIELIKGLAAVLAIRMRAAVVGQFT
jgi:CRP/FNR family cyclic AMP-dependent transcriptional regulator